MLFCQRTILLFFCVLYKLITLSTPKVVALYPFLKALKPCFVTFTQCLKMSFDHYDNSKIFLAFAECLSLKEHKPWHEKIDPMRYKHSCAS